MVLLNIDDSLGTLVLQELQYIRQRLPTEDMPLGLREFERILGPQLPTTPQLTCLAKRKRNEVQAGGEGGNPRNGADGARVANHVRTTDETRNAKRKRLTSRQIGMHRMQLFRANDGGLSIRGVPIAISRNVRAQLQAPDTANYISATSTPALGDSFSADVQNNAGEGEAPGFLQHPEFPNMNEDNFSENASPEPGSPLPVVTNPTNLTGQSNQASSLRATDTPLQPGTYPDASHNHLNEGRVLVARDHGMCSSNVATSAECTLTAPSTPVIPLEVPLCNETDDHDDDEETEFALTDGQWTIGPAPPPPVDTGEYLGDLTCILSPSAQYHLNRLLKELRLSYSEEDTRHTIPAKSLSRRLCRSLGKCQKYDTKTRLHDFLFMVCALEMALEIDSLGLDKTEISKESGIDIWSIRYWYKVGKRALVLSAAAGPSILLMIASLQLKTKLLCNTKCGIKGIMDLAFEFRNPGSSVIGNGVRDILIPYIHFLNRSTASIPSLKITFPDGQSIPFFMMRELDEHFSKAKLEIFNLPARSVDWSNNLEKLPGSSDAVINGAVRKAKVLQADWTLKQTSRPTKAKETKSWTKKERLSAAKACCPTTLDEFFLRWKGCKSEERKRSGYLRLDPALCNGDTIRFEDQKGKFLGLLITHLDDELPEWNDDMNTRIQLLFPNEFYKDDSSREDHNYTAFHFYWYNRYAEKGHSAPQHNGAHPNFLYKTNSPKINYAQRNPWLSKETKENPERYDCLSMMLEDIVAFIQANLREHLPEEYDELRVYCDRLPAGEQSPVYPFGGFVLNICACTTGHRDTGDKNLCVVVPFGDFEGGEICFYETKTVIALRPGDIFIFPSGELTHFNLHFKGWRGSFVLHTDRQSDSWVKDFNGWKWKSTSEYVRVDEDMPA